ncbi:hypothetical protein AB0P40_31845, partial [Streptomyces sp. NPDC079189]|uniref:hypothetical protein n=1 Tax=Streptomyces sp. NPDC079189 TaxID=3154514 RepID=UPI00342AA2C1
MRQGHGSRTSGPAALRHSTSSGQTPRPGHLTGRAPAQQTKRPSPLEEGLDDPGEVFVRLLDDVEGERVLVLVGVAD